MNESKLRCDPIHFNHYFEIESPGTEMKKHQEMAEANFTNPYLRGIQEELPQAEVAAVAPQR